MPNFAPVNMNGPNASLFKSQICSIQQIVYVSPITHHRACISFFPHISEDSRWLAWFPTVPLFNLVKWRERYSTDWIFLVSITKRRGHATYVGNTLEIRLFPWSANAMKEDTLRLGLYFHTTNWHCVEWLKQFLCGSEVCLPPCLF